jgi:hypothetical protein
MSTDLGDSDGIIYYGTGLEEGDNGKRIFQKQRIISKCQQI